MWIHRIDAMLESPLAQLALTPAPHGEWDTSWEWIDPRSSLELVLYGGRF